MNDLRCFCLVAVGAVLSCTTSPPGLRASLDTAPSATAPAGRPASLDLLEVPVSEVRAECSRKDLSTQLFSAILALPGGTVLAAAREHGGWLMTRRADGTECHAAVRCDAFIVQAHDRVWCVHARFSGPIPDRYTDGPPEVEIGYTLDSGMTWLRGRLDPSVIKIAAVGLPNARGFHFVSYPGGELWRAEASRESTSLRLWQMSPKAPGERGSEVALFSKSTFCVQRYGLGSEDYFSRRWLCRDNEGGEWRDGGRSGAFYATSGAGVWWGLEDGARLRRSALDPSRWEDVKDAADLTVHVMSQQGGAGGRLFAVASRGATQLLLGIGAGGRIEQRVPLRSLHVTAIGAEGGVVALAAAEGLFVLEGDSLREVLRLRGELP